MIRLQIHSNVHHVFAEYLARWAKLETELVHAPPIFDVPANAKVSLIQKDSASKRLRSRQGKESAPSGFLTMPNGVFLSAEDEMHVQLLFQEIFVERHYLPDLPEKFARQLGFPILEAYKPQYVIDVGANIGMFTMFLADRYPNLTIHAFEPVPILVEHLQRNVRYHGLSVRVWNLALARQSGDLNIRYFPRFSGLSGAFADKEVERIAIANSLRAGITVLGGDALKFWSQLDAFIDNILAESIEYQVRATSLSEFLAQESLPHVDLLKIDAEKAELEILSGVHENHWNLIRQVVLEFHSELHSIGVQKFLIDRGFAVTLAPLGGDGQGILYATRKGIDSLREQ